MVAVMDRRKQDYSSDPMLLKDILSDVIQDKRKTHAHDFLRNVQVFRVWEKVAGTFIRKHAAPNRFERRKLYIELSHPSWKVELQFKKQELLEKLNKELGKDLVQDIVFYLSHSPKFNKVD